MALATFLIYITLQSTQNTFELAATIALATSLSLAFSSQIFKYKLLI